MAKTRCNRTVLLWSVVLGLTLLQGIVWWLVTPPWTAPDEPGHYLYVRLIAEQGSFSASTAGASQLWPSVLASMEQSGWRQYLHPNGDISPNISQEPVLAASGSQIGHKPPAYYALAAIWLRIHPNWRGLSLAQQMRWIRLFSLALRLLTTAVALFLAVRLWPEAPARIVGLGILVGLLPMVGFIGVSLNNDALTMFWGAIAFAALLLALSPGSWLLTLAIIISGPLLVDTTLLFLWPLLLWRWLVFRNENGLKLREFQWWRPIIKKGMILGMLALTLLLMPNPYKAAGWRSRHAQQTRWQHKLFLRANNDNNPATILQTISGKEILQRQGQTIILDAMVAGQGDALMLQLTDGHHKVTRACPLTPTPHPCRLKFKLSALSQHLTVSASLLTGWASFQLRLTDARGWSLLTNGDGIHSALLVQPLFTWWERHLPLPSGYFSRLFASSVWDVPSLLRYAIFAGFTWASFWGYFGWLSRPFPWYTYILEAVLTLAAIIGVARKLLSHPETISPSERSILLFALMALALILAQTWFPMLGQAWQPQGRYLFPALLPIAILLLLGWEAVLPHRLRHHLPYLLTLILLLLNLQAWRITMPY